MPDIFDSQKRSDIMRSVKNKNTLPEVVIQSLLTEMGYTYELNISDIKYCKPDITISSKRKVLFVNGCFWHGHDCKRGHLPSTNKEFWESKIAKNKDRDTKNYAKLKSDGWNFLVIWNCEIKKKNYDNLKEKLSSFLEQEGF